MHFKDVPVHENIFKSKHITYAASLDSVDNYKVAKTSSLTE